MLGLEAISNYVHESSNNEARLERNVTLTPSCKVLLVANNFVDCALLSYTGLEGVGNVL